MIPLDFRANRLEYGFAAWCMVLPNRAIGNSWHVIFPARSGNSTWQKEELCRLEMWSGSLCFVSYFETTSGQNQ
jgi:hypothetical protein